MATPTDYPDHDTEVTFEEDPTEVTLEEDPSSLNMTPENKPIYRKIKKPLCVILRNMNDQVLLIKNNRAAFEEMTDSEICVNAYQTHFTMQRYKDPAKGCLLVTLSVRTEEKTYTMSCKDKILSFKEEAAPDNIVDETDFLFCIEAIIGYKNRKYFRSLLYPQHYLACEYKTIKDFLILKYFEIDESNERPTPFRIHYCEKFCPQNKRDLRD
ncbi:interleukin-18-like isoform X2 [Sminthopsis crassicaudata]